MVRRTVSSTILILGFALMGVQPAQANTPLTRAVVSSLLNQVRLLPKSKPARKAQLTDVLKPGDGIVTSRRSLAELRFNDGSLARMGEQAVFRFIPKTRSFRLSNGTVLMLIPPGQGRTQVRTPNVTAGIRGSALMIRYDKATDTSTVIALTNSQISVTNRDQTQTQVLEAGQAVVTSGDRIVGSYDVNLAELYRTSPMLKDLDMDNPDAPVKDKAIAQVREETLEGIRSQRSFAEGEGSDLTAEFRLSEVNVDSVVADETGRPFGSAVPTLPEMDPDMEISGEGSFPGPAIGVNGPLDKEGNNEITIPTVVTPPVIVTPPVDPVLQPPVAVDPPVVEPPIVADPPIFVEPPIAVDPPSVIEEPPIAADPPFIDDQVVLDSPPLDGGDLALPGGDDLIGEVDVDNAPIADGGDLPDGIIPGLGDFDGAVLQPEVDGPIVNPVDSEFPGSDALIGELEVDNTPISGGEDALPDGIPSLDSFDGAALQPAEQNDDLGIGDSADVPDVVPTESIPVIDDAVMENPASDNGTLIDLTVTIGGESTVIEGVIPGDGVTVIQSPVSTDSAADQSADVPQPATEGNGLIDF